MISAPRAVLLALLAIVSVNGHGTVSGIVANGRSYRAPLPRSGANLDSPVREISTLEPLTDPNSASMKCGPGAASSARATAEVTAGTDIGFRWTSGPNMRWPHCYGPVMLYAYKCPGAARDCKPPSDASWFLIDAAGINPSKANAPGCERWVQHRFMLNETVSARVPKGMQNGEYLFRHEIIALHVATTRGAEYYVSCTQVRVVGGVSTSAKAAGADMAAFPGEYNRNQPGLKANVFGNINANNYKMPGPKLFTGAKTGSPAPAPTTTQSSKPTASSSKPPSSGSSKPSAGSSKPTSNSPRPTNTTPPSSGGGKRPGIRCRAPGSVLIQRSLKTGKLESIVR